MNQDGPALADWTPEAVAAGRRQVEAWRRAGPVLERLRRQELRELDSFSTIAALCGPADYSQPPFSPAATSGLIEQQRWFALARRP